MISVYAIRHCRCTCILLIVLLLLLLPTSRLWLFFPVLGILFNSCVNYCSFFHPILVIVTLNRYILFIVYSLLSFICRLLLLSKIGNIRNNEYWISNSWYFLLLVFFFYCMFSHRRLCCWLFILKVNNTFYLFIHIIIHLSTSIFLSFLSLFLYFSLIRRRQYSNCIFWKPNLFFFFNYLSENSSV